MFTRRLLILAFVLVAPIAAACSVSPTGVDDEPPPPAPTDTTKRGDGWPWT
jgi:hypothetical protein